MIRNLLAALPGRAADQLRDRVRDKMVSGLLLAFALFFAGIALLAGIAAIGVVLASHYGALAACLIIAAAALVVMLVLLGVMALRWQEARRRKEAEREEWLRAMMLARAVLPALVPGKTLLVVTMLGLLAGVLTGAGKSPDDE